MEDLTTTAAEAETVSGIIRYRGTVGEGGDYFFSSHSGRIVLELPPDANADVRVATMSGGRSLDHSGITETVTRSRSRSRVTLGSGGAEIEVETFSGSVTIRDWNR